jgi:histidine kinase/histidine kinase/DNA gyrase B/HSP90-like ATPase
MASVAYLVNDPEHAPAGASWMRGITPARLGMIALVCFLYHTNNPSFVNEPFFPRVGKTLHNAAVFLLAALPMYVLVVRTEIGTALSPPRVRILALVGAVVLGAVIFPLVRHALRIGQLPVIGTSGSFWEYSLGHFFKALVFGGLFTSILYFATRERDAARRLHLTQLSRAEIDKQVVEARLQLLQAQIEPHFLFNSLASVKRLYEKEPAKGRSLLRNLGDYLRIAISRARLRETPLDEEIALARSFLAIFEVRMGQRLRVRIDVPKELESALIPPLMVGTLVENAIKHGISPRASGGVVSITARRDGNVLEVKVADDGVGFRTRSGHGVGLANTRARLETLFAAAGSLELAANAGGGVTATVRLPYSGEAP